MKSVVTFAGRMGVILSGLVVSSNPCSGAVIPPLLGAPVTLVWDASAGSGVAGYAIYYGVANGPVTNRVDTGLNRTATLQNLVANVTYSAFAVAYNNVGLESNPSASVNFTPLPRTRLQIARQSSGSVLITLEAPPLTTRILQCAPTPTSTSWQTLAVMVTDPNGKATLIDPLAANRPSRYYRAQ